MKKEKALNIKDLPKDLQKQIGKQVKTYSKAEVIAAAGAIIVALGASGLPLHGQREALDRVQKWLSGLTE